MIQYRELNVNYSKYRIMNWENVDTPVDIDETDFMLYQFKINDEFFPTPSKRFFELLEKENMWLILKI